jgi:hypothetical protein
MPTHKADLSRLSITQIAELTGRAKETVSRLLRAAGVSPADQDGRTLYFDPRVALPVVFEVGQGLSLDAERARLAKEQADAKAMENAVTRGELLSRTEQEGLLVAVATTIRGALLAFEARLAPALDGAATIAQRAVVIREHVHEALSALAGLGGVAHGVGGAAESLDGIDGVGGDAPAAEEDSERVGRRRARAQPRGQRRTRPVENEPG